MGTKKRPQSDSGEDVTADTKGMAVDEKSLQILQNLKPMERKKQRKSADKEKHRLDKPVEIQVAPPPPLLPTSLPAFHINAFRDLSSPESLVRESAVEAMVGDLRDVQRAYEKLGADTASVQLEAQKDDGLEDLAPSLRYAIRRLIRGTSSSRECARQGFALGLTSLVAIIPSVKVDSLLKLIVDLLEVSSSMKGQDVRECLLGRLFAYGSLARSGRVAAEWKDDNSSPCVNNFISHVVSLADKKRYLRESAISIILHLVEQLPLDALLSQVLKAPGMNEWFQNAAENGDSDVLYLALKLQDKLPRDTGMYFANLLPYPFNSNCFFTRDHLLTLSPCFKESTFCMPRVHSLWPLLVNMLVRDMASQDEDVPTRSSIKKHKRSRKGSSFEEITKSIHCFYEVVVEESLLQSSHDRKHLAFDVLLLILPSLPASCIQMFLSHKLVNCLIDILSTERSWLYNAAQHFLKELLSWAGNDNNRCVGVIMSLQKHTSGRFDYFTRTRAVKELVAKLTTSEGCEIFVDELISFFVDEGPQTDEPSDQSQTTDENLDITPVENKDFPENMDSLKVWVVDTLPRIFRTLKPENAESLVHDEKVKNIEAKLRLQTKVMKFLAVQGLFSASLGTEVTSFELQETFKWPKASSSSSLRKMCIEQLQSLLVDAQKGEGSNVIVDGLELSDLGSDFMHILNALCNIPSVTLYRTLSNDDDESFKQLQTVESRLSHEERNLRPGLQGSKFHVLRYLLIQLLLQVLLHPGEFSEAASELCICSNKFLHFSALAGASEDDDDIDPNDDNPELMDVLVDTLLSLLLQSSAAMRFAVEQVFRLFCNDITDDGLLQMLRIVKKDLKPARHQVNDGDSADDDDDDFLGIEEAEETDEAEAAEAADNDVHEDSSEGMNRCGSLGIEKADEEATMNNANLPDSDESDGGMDDDAMFRVESHLARLFKERKISSGHENANSQLVPFKLRVLSLLEIYLQRNTGRSHVLMVCSYLAQAFVRAHAAEGSQQLVQRIGGILQKKIFKAKDYPKGDDIQLTTLVTMLEKSLKSASRSRRKEVSSLAQTSTFWILKIIHARKYSESELEKVVEVFQHILVDYFENKKSRLKSSFVKEVVKRCPWIGSQLFGFLVKKCGSLESEYQQIEILDVVDCIMRSWTLTGKGDKDKDASSKSSELVKKHLPALCELIQELLTKLPKTQQRRAQVRRFCTKVLQVVSQFNLKKKFLKALKPDAYSACESQLGAVFLPFKKHTS